MKHFGLIDGIGSEFRHQGVSTFLEAPELAVPLFPPRPAVATPRIGDSAVIRLAAALMPDSIVNGEGLRTVLWTQGCHLRCPGCQNPHTHDLNGGFVETVASIKEKLAEIKMQRGITFSGGEPFLQAEVCTEIARFARTLGWDVWCFSGYTYEYLSLQEKHRAFLEQIDVLVDGPFIQAERDHTLKFRGSRNQRILRLREA
ncbi:MAG: anaerobic ribonucleoside-triphosphate reductase activating protein [Puniceicoccales bacterium]|nr:anaerobic ribonucleoside-triphosphate reductase activating protein [Puniceicoccales bacterium]